jgi:hypothetical protein
MQLGWIWGDGLVMKGERDSGRNKCESIWLGRIIGVSEISRIDFDIDIWILFPQMIKTSHRRKLTRRRRDDVGSGMRWELYLEKKEKVSLLCRLHAILITTLMDVASSE